MHEQAAALLELVRHCAMPDGEIACRGTWIRQQGEIRLAPSRPWLPFEAEEWFEKRDVDFRWRAWVAMAPFVKARVVDSFDHGRGSLAVSLFGLVPIVRSQGAETDKGEALRGLAELPWHPFAFRPTPSLRWEAAAGDKLRGTYDDGKTQVTSEFEIDRDGRVLGGTALRPRLVGKTAVETTWSGIFGLYRNFGKLSIPTVGEATWQLPEGPLTYWRGRVTELRVL